MKTKTGISLSRRGSKWRIVLQYRGARREVSAPGDLSESRARKEVGGPALERLRREVDGGGPRPTLWTYCAEVYRHEHGLAPRSWRARQYVVAYIMVRWQDVPIDQLTTAMVGAWVRELEARGLGEYAVRNYLAALGAIYRVAEERGDIERRAWHAPRRPPLSQEKAYGYWTADDCARFLATAEKRDPGIWRIARFMMLTGCRPEEVLRVRWDHVREVPSPALLILGGKGRGGRRFRERWLPLVGELGAFMASLPRSEEGGHVFAVEKPGKRGARGYKVFPEHRWARIAKMVGLATAPYCVRHTYITDLVERGFPLQDIAAAVGNSAAMIDRHYWHRRPEAIVGVMLGDGPRNVGKIVGSVGPDRPKRGTKK